MKTFVSSWNSSKKPGKQRKYRAKAPLHKQGSLVRSALSAELKKKYGKKNVSVRVGDKVKVMRGDFKKKEGVVQRLLKDKQLVFVEGVERSKKDGTKTPLGLRAHDLQITELNIEEKKRKNILSRK